MGLRINSDRGVLTSLRALQTNSSNLNKTLEKLSTGLKINRASDDPANFVLASLLRSQVGGLDQAISNSENAVNLIGTAEAGLDEVSRQLTELRGDFVRALGTNDPNQLGALQQSINSRLSSIDRIGGSTRFGNINLFNGSTSISAQNIDGAISQLEINSVNFGGSGNVNFDVNVTAAATRGTDTAGAIGAVVANGGPVDIHVQGALGSATVSLQAGATGQNLIDAINGVSGSTGVVAANQAGTVQVQTSEYGSDQNFQVQALGGSGVFVPGTLSGAGTDLQGNVNGETFSAQGNVIQVSGNALDARITLADGTGPGAYSFDALSSGLTFQLGGTSGDSITIGTQNISTGSLGTATRTVNGQTVGGFLSSLAGGGSNDVFHNPGNALDIIDSAIAQVNRERGYLGSVQANVVESNLNSLSIASENLQASLSQLQDADFAEEILNLTRNQVAQRAGISSLLAANIQRDSVLQLLGG